MRGVALRARAGTSRVRVCRGAVVRGRCGAARRGGARGRAAVVRERAAGVRKCRAAAGPAPPARVSGGRWRRGVRRAAHRPHSPAAGAVAIVFRSVASPAGAGRRRNRPRRYRPFVFIITVFGFRTTATNPYNAANAIKRKPAITGGGEGATAGQRRAYARRDEIQV
jgi:hypothetical protein